jgi:hypothetical protein
VNTAGGPAGLDQARAGRSWPKPTDTVSFEVFSRRAGFRLPSGVIRQAEACPTEISEKTRSRCLARVMHPLHATALALAPACAQRGGNGVNSEWHSELS